LMEPLSEGVVVLYHGTSVRSGLALLNGASLDIITAMAQKLDGPPGFFLATHAEDAAYFAARRGEGTILRFVLLPQALQRLHASGALFRPIPVGNVAYFYGSEFFVPPFAFEEFNKQLMSGGIDVQPHTLQ
jgi:hypothetical protein